LAAVAAAPNFVALLVFAAGRTDVIDLLLGSQER